jgi:hypothetical protein
MHSADSHLRVIEVSGLVTILLPMTLTTLIVTNALLGGAVTWALVRLLVRGVHADRRHRVIRAAEIRSLPAPQRNRIAA